MGKGSTFGGPAGGEENITLEELQNALGSPVNNLPPIVRRRVDALENLQKQYTTLLKQYQAEVRELDRKYQKLYDPIHDKRATVITGSYEPTDEEAHVEKDEEEEEGVQKKEASPSDAEIKGVPNFWLEVLQNHNFVAQSIFEDDEEALSFLKDIRYSELDGSEGFSLSFHFAENPYFTNTTLIKTYVMEQDEVFGELEYSHATGTTIEWKAGKNLTVKQTKKKTKAKGKKPARVLTVEEPCDSFFSFFSPIQPPKGDENPEIDEEDAEQMESDFDIGCIIKDKLIPFAVKWFTGEAAEYDGDDFGMDGEDDMYGDEDDEEDEEEEEDDEDEEEERAPKRGGGKRGGAGHSFAPPPGVKGGAGAPGQPQQPECKQQ